MKAFNKISIYLASTVQAMVALLCFSCVYDPGENPVAVEREYQVGLTLSLDRIGATRTIDAGDLPGTGYENYIDILGRDFMFLFFDDNNKYLETMTVNELIPSDDSQYPSLYHVLGSIKSPIEGTFKLAVLTNWGTYPAADALKVGETTIEDVCAGNLASVGIFEYSPTSAAPYIPSADTPIPMYGVKSYSGVEFKDGFAADLGTIDLLCSVAKVVLRCKEGLDVELATVKLRNYSSTAYAAPVGMYDNTVNHGPYDNAHVPASSAVNADLDFTKLSDGGYIIYIPEYDNDATLHSSVVVTFTYDPATEYEIRFCEYVDGKPVGDDVDVLRNYCYDYTISKQRDLIIEVDVVPYGEVKLDPIFGINP